MISIITATYNAAEQINNLISSLQSQTDKDFEWIVADGGSTDGTLDLLSNITDIKIILDSRPDFGIYDALNRAIHLSHCDYYLVVGADDILAPNAVELYRKLAQESRADAITTSVLAGGKIVTPNRGRTWLYGPFATFSCHAVGTLIKKSTHNTLGYYSKMYPLAADQLFLVKLIDSDFNIAYGDFIAGEFSDTGASGTNILSVLCDIYRVKREVRNDRFLQTIIFILRLLKNHNRI